MTSTVTTGAATPDRIKGKPWQLWASTLARVTLAGILLVAGGLKVGDPDQAAAAVQAYRIFPAAVGEIIGYGLPVFEIAIGLLLLIGLGTRIAAIITAVLMVLFIAGVASAWARGLRIDCGCFGGGGDLAAGIDTQYVQEIVRDLLFLGLAVWLIIFPASRFALDKPGIAGTGHTGILDELDEDDEWDDDTDLPAGDGRETATAEPKADDEEQV
jgi:uncharacterized membrane protein YphA (DoxX/SURF4 family)